LSGDSRTKSFILMMFRFLRRSLVRALPHNRWGDWVYYRVYFLYAHRRWPNHHSRLISDRWFGLLATSEGMDALRQFTSDKAYVKHYIGGKVGSSYCVPTLALLSEASSLKRLTFDVPYVVKPSHNSQTVVYVDAGQHVTDDDFLRLADTLRNRYSEHRERNYRYLPPRLIIEPALAAQSEMIDYKVHCRNGVPKIVQVDIGRHEAHRQAFYTTDWQALEIRYIAEATDEIPRPAELSEMLHVAQTLAEDIGDVRVDLYLVEGRIFVGELTHVPNRSFGRFGSIEDERKFSAVFFGE
jgi:hypothetical protein